MKALGMSLLLAAWTFVSFQLAYGTDAAPDKAAEEAAAKEADKPAEKPVLVVKTPPLKGSQLPVDKNNCIMCHGEADIWDDKSRHLFISKDMLANDAHWKKGVNCHDCHGGDPKADEKNPAHALEDGFRAKPADLRNPEDVRKFCGVCHKDQALELFKGMHVKGGEEDSDGRRTLLNCTKCHGEKIHSLLPAGDSRSPVFLDNQVRLCGDCHQKELATYRNSVHGKGLYESGLLVTASCASCHGAHGIYLPADNRSTLHSSRVAHTCGKCHRFIEDRLAKSAHGNDPAVWKAAGREPPNREGKIFATCTACHQGHDLLNPKSLEFRLRLPDSCGNCHAAFSHRYALSLHGSLTQLGYGPGAKCSDCHGFHDILPVNHPDSAMSPANRQKTCQECHPNATAKFCQFDPHADHTNGERNMVLFVVYRVLLTLLFTTFSVFGLHSLLWFVRSFVDVVKNGRAHGPRARQEAYQRFSTFHRRGHAMLMISFLGLTLTGLPLKYSTMPWAHNLARGLGGFESTSVLHRMFGLLTFAVFFTYIGLLIRGLAAARRQGKTWRAIVFGPDSPVPNWRDLKDFFKMILWFFGLGPKPTFERWSYWEKFDFWGAMADVVLIGLTGLILWLPNLFCSILPGVTLNIAKVVHSTQALLATGFVFAVHFFNTHMRPDKFPADRSVLTGLVSEEEFMEERPDYFERMRREGRLDAMRVTAPSRASLWSVTLGGFIALSVGLALLAGMIAAGLN